MLWCEERDAAPNYSVTLDEWCENLYSLQEVDSISSFWCLWNNLKSVMGLPDGSVYNFFKKGVKPVWEDAKNDGGGRWVFILPRDRDGTAKIRQEYFARTVDETWITVVLSLIGNTIDPQDIVCGTVVQVRSREIRFAVWTRKVDDATLLNFGHALHAKLEHLSNSELSYRLHSAGTGKRRTLPRHCIKR